MRISRFLSASILARPSQGTKVVRHYNVECVEGVTLLGKFLCVPLSSYYNDVLYHLSLHCMTQIWRIVIVTAVTASCHEMRKSGVISSSIRAVEGQPSNKG